MNSPVFVKNKTRIVLVFFIVGIVMCALLLRMAQHQIVNAKELTEKAIRQQTKDVSIQPKRGVIYDRNMKQLATSTMCYTLWAHPPLFRTSNGLPREEAQLNEMALSIANVLSMDPEQVKSAITAEESVVELAIYLSRETADEVRKLGMPGLSLGESSKRNYPNGTLAAQVLGSVNYDNSGRAGLELQYDQYLSGVAGRWVKNTDLNGNKLVEGSEEYFEATDGLNLVTTLDELIQYYAEKAVDKGMITTGAKRIMCLVMNPKTGEILASAISGKYDPNDPMTPIDPNVIEAMKDMSAEEKDNYLFSLWRNPLVSDVYEPGSTFKLITVSSALEDGTVTTDSTFSCFGGFTVSGVTLHCWFGGHGTQNLYDAVKNSCNPAHASIATNMGVDTFYSYLDKYGITRKTGVDYPGETDSILVQRDKVGPVELCTIGYGQGIALTPIQLLTAVNAIGNGGYLIQPRYAKALTDKDGKVVKAFEPRVMKQVISAETAREMRQIMQYNIDANPGVMSPLMPYRIGGKTGTANKVEGGAYKDNYMSSFLGMAPMDDPQVSVLVVVDSPQGDYYGSVVASPIALEIMQDIVRHLEIKPTEEAVEN